MSHEKVTLGRLLNRPVIKAKVWMHEHSKDLAFSLDRAVLLRRDKVPKSDYDDLLTRIMPINPGLAMGRLGEERAAPQAFHF